MKRRFSLLSLPFAAGTGGLLGLLPAASRAQEAATPEAKIDQLIGLLNDPEVQAVLKSHAATVPDGIAAEAHPITAWLELTRSHLHDVGAAVLDAPQTISQLFSELALRLGGWNLPIAIVFLAALVFAAFAAGNFAERKLRALGQGAGAAPQYGDRLVLWILTSLTAIFTAIIGYLILPWPEGVDDLVRPWLVAGVAMFVVIRLTRSLEADTPTPQAAQEAAHWCGFTRRIAAVFLVGWAVAQTLVVLGSGRDFALLVAYIFGLALIVMGSRAVWTRPVSPTVTPSRRMAISLGFTLAFVALGALWVADMVIILWVCIYLVGLPVLLPLITRLVRGSAQVLIPGDEEDTAEGTEGTEGAEAAAPVHSGPKLVPRVPSIRSVIVDRGARLLVLALAMGWLMSVLNSHAERFMQTEVVTRLIGGVFQGIIVLIVADFLWQLAKVAILQREAEALQFTTDPEQRARNSRLRTLLPILRHTVAVLIAIVAVLTVLAGLGVAIGPLIAGAGIFGVAIGFGSQTLVKDIISGVFYLLDDAFRVGEYIQSGSYKGVVEGFSLRSIRLRHHRGPVFTVPFGSLGAVQNMSRDWGKDKMLITVPFDTDLEKVRKIAKKIGQTIMEDPELGPAIIEPVKLKGVEQVTENGLVLGLGMMFKPTGEQTMIRRRAYAMLHKAFAENDIEFAKPVVQVSGGEEDQAAAARAARMAAERKAAEAGG